MKKVIDGDYSKVLETFNESESKTIKAKYQAMGKFSDVEFDIDGDLIVFED